MRPNTDLVLSEFIALRRDAEYRARINDRAAGAPGRREDNRSAHAPHILRMTVAERAISQSRLSQYFLAGRQIIPGRHFKNAR